MTGLMGGHGRPKEKPGDLDRVRGWLDYLSVDKKTRSYFDEVYEARLKHDEAEKKANAAIADAKARDAQAREAEQSARSEREAADTAKLQLQTDSARAEAAQEKEAQRLKEWTEKLEAMDSDLNRREAALRRAFKGYYNETQENEDDG